MPTAFRQISPRPLGLHLAATTTGLTMAAAAAPLAVSGGVPWHPALADEAAELTAALRDVDPNHFTEVVRLLVAEQMAGMIRGIRAYHAHPAVRNLPPAATVWRHGAARLLDFGGGGAPLLLAPSLVNNSDVLDLDRDGSLCRWLAAEGVVRPYLLDWGAPGPAETGFGLQEYITGPLCAALDFVVAETGGPALMLGYCMGGVLTLAAAQLWPEKTAALALLAAPWDFHADMAPSARAIAGALPVWRPMLESFGAMPFDFMQGFFAGLDPGLTQRKFSDFADMEMDGAAARRFVLMEDWLNSGPPLASRVALQTLGGWFGENDTAAGRWRIAGRVIDPGKIACPVFVAIPGNDRIVPPASALALSAALPEPAVIRPGAGHIGMVVGSAAEEQLWAPLNRWLAALRP